MSAPDKSKGESIEPPVVNPQLDNLINMAKESNAKLVPPPTSTHTNTPPPATTKPVEPKEETIKETLTEALISITVGEKLEAHKTEIIAIFKNHGMDTMSQTKAWDELMSVLTLEK